MIRVIDDDGKMLGVFQVADAVKMSYEKGLDLIEIAPDANPPTCKIQINWRRNASSPGRRPSTPRTTVPDRRTAPPPRVTMCVAAIHFLCQMRRPAIAIMSPTHHRMYCLASGARRALIWSTKVANISRFVSHRSRHFPLVR